MNGNERKKLSEDKPLLCWTIILSWWRATFMIGFRLLTLTQGWRGVVKACYFFAVLTCREIAGGCSLIDLQLDFHGLHLCCCFLFVNLRPISSNHARTIEKGNSFWRQSEKVRKKKIEDNVMIKEKVACELKISECDEYLKRKLDFVFGNNTAVEIQI